MRTVAYNCNNFWNPIFVSCVLLIFHSVAEAQNHPGDVFALDVWKLTIPFDDNGDGEADEVTMPTLRYFEDPEFFFLSNTKDSILFRAPCGAPATANSKYPRSELREMKKGGKEKASWGTGDGKVHNLTLEAAVTAVPLKKPHVVCAQIHDETDDLLMVRMEGKKLFIERNELEPVMLDKNYELGSFFHLMIIADHGRIRVFFEQKQVMEWKVEASGLYFKAGCYTQSNLSRGDAPDSFGEVEIRKLFVTHKSA